MATATMTIQGSTSRFAQSRSALAASSRRSSRTSISRVQSTPSRRSSTTSIVNPQGTQAPSTYLLSDQEAFAAAKTKDSFWSRHSSKDAQYDSRSDLLLKRVTALKASFQTIRTEYQSWKARVEPNNEDATTTKIDKLALQFDTRKLAALRRQAHTESMDCARLAAQWLIGRTNPQKQSWYAKIGRVQSDYPVLKNDIEVLLKEIQIHTAARVAQQMNLKQLRPVMDLKASMKAILEEYRLWQATAVPDEDDPRIKKIEKLAMRFDISRLVAILKQGNAEGARTTGRVQAEYASLKKDTEGLLKEMQTYAAARLAQQTELEREERVEHTRKNMPRPAFLPGNPKYTAPDGSTKYKRVIHEQLYERLAADDKRIYVKGGLFYLYTSPTADPNINRLLSNSPWHVRMVKAGTIIQIKQGDSGYTLDLLRNGQWCVRYIEVYNHQDPGWLAEVVPIQTLQFDNIMPKPPRCGPYTDQANYQRRWSTIMNEAPFEWADNDENNEEPPPTYTPEYTEGLYKRLVKRAERARLVKLGRLCHLEDVVYPAQRKAAVRRVERIRCRQLGRLAHVADLVRPVVEQDKLDKAEHQKLQEQYEQLEMEEYWKKKAEKKAARERRKAQQSGRT